MIRQIAPLPTGVLYYASTNPGKLQEFILAAAQFKEASFSLKPLPQWSSIPACQETGATFEANAIQKALHYGSHSSGWVFADDSGLEVDWLKGGPGIFSARWARETASDAANNALLLEKLQDIRERGAQFVCVIALAADGKLVRTFRGVVRGKILTAPRGNNGFGYDPLFYCPLLGCSFGESPALSKLAVSHRGKALRKMLNHLRHC